MGRWIIIAGIILIIIGAIMQFAPGLLNWFGRLPGDIRIETGNKRIHIPLTSMVIVSILLTLLLNLIKR